MTEIKDKLKEKLNQLPQLPGIYKMLDSKGNILYIGKSKSLKRRVKTYFTDSQKWEKIETLTFFIDDIDYIVTDTHLEARLLECELIKEFKPIFNSQMKNDKGYVYLKLENYNRFNGLSVVSDREAYTYGPFRKKYSLHHIIQSLNHFFPITKNSSGYELEYHIIPLSMNPDAFMKNRSHLIEIFSDDTSMNKIIQTLEIQMKESAALYRYETAAKYRDMIQGFKYIKNGIWRYEEMMSKDILLKIPSRHGYKLFFISNGDVLARKNYHHLNSVDIDLFITNNYSLKPSMSINKHKKADIDFRDILYSEINSLPGEMIMYL